MSRAPRQSVIIAIGGDIAVGKTSIAWEVEHHLNSIAAAKYLSTDDLRMGLYGVSHRSQLPDSAFSDAARDKLYNSTLISKATEELKNRSLIILDGTFSRSRYRSAITEFATTANASFCGIILSASEETRICRACKRLLNPTANPYNGHPNRSIADPRKIKDWYFESLTAAEKQEKLWREINAERPFDNVKQSVLSLVGAL